MTLPRIRPSVNSMGWKAGFSGTRKTAFSSRPQSLQRHRSVIEDGHDHLARSCRRRPFDEDAIPVVDIGVDHALSGHMDEEDVAALPPQHPGRNVHGLVRDIEGLARHTGGNQAGHRHPDLSLAPRREPGKAELPVFAPEITLPLQARHVLERRRWVGKPRSLASSRTVGVNHAPGRSLR